MRMPIIWFLSNPHLNSFTAAQYNKCVPGPEWISQFYTSVRVFYNGKCNETTGVVCECQWDNDSFQIRQKRVKDLVA